MTYVYILYTYSEDGAEDVGATLDRSTLLEFIDINWPLEGPSIYQPGEDRSESEKQHLSEWRDRARTRLAEVLIHDDTKLASQNEGWECSDGWGGMKLHVVKLHGVKIQR
jgi:hypothetical protein